MLVGRDAELSRIHGALDSASQACGSTLLVHGDLGVGKTSLLEAALQRSAKVGFRVARGRAWSIDAGLPYAPIVEALTPILRRDPNAPAWTAGLDDLGRLFPALEGARPVPEGEPALARTRLFESMVQLVERIGASKPLAFLLDDMHHADAATVQLLHYLARRAVNQHVLYIVAYRSQELRGNPELVRATEALVAAERAQRVAVGPLSSPYIRAVAVETLGSAISNDLCDFLAERSLGIPLVLVAILADMQAANEVHRIAATTYRRGGVSKSVPANIRAMFATRLALLSPGARSAAATLSVAGDAVSLQLLAAASHIDEARLVDLLEGLATAGWVSVHEHGYGFAHPLAQETAYDALTEVERRRLHLAFLHARQRLTPDDSLRIAQHLHGLGASIDDVPAAVDLLRSAAAQAEARTSYRDAARCWRLAADLTRSRGAPGLAEALSRLGEMLNFSGDGIGSLAALEEARRLFEDAERGELVAAIRGLQARFAAELGDEAACDEHLREGLEAAKGLPASDGISRFYTSAQILLTRRRDPARLLAMQSELSLPDGHGDYAIEHCRALTGLVECDFAAAVDAARRALGRASDPLAVMRSRFVLGQALSAFGDVPAAIEAWKTTEQEARFYPDLAATPVLAGALALFDQGEIQAGLEKAQMAHVHARRQDHQRQKATSQAFIGLCLFHLGERAAAHEYLRDVDEDPGIPPGPLGVRQRALARLALGDDDAKSALRHLADHADPTMQVSALDLRGEAHHMRGDVEGLAVVAAELDGLPHCPRTHATAQRVRGLLQALTEDGRAYATLERSAQGFAAMGMRLEQARTRVLALELTGTTDVEATRWCLEVLSAQRDQPGSERARALARRQGMNPTRARPNSSPLSARELQVARLAASGLTNARVAKELFLSPHTVATHIKKIYARIGVSSRTALRRWMLEHGEPKIPES